ncbi:tyrosine--tRNA ligase 1, cytoplasmic-like protein [Tanacetum coccineum]
MDVDEKLQKLKSICEECIQEEELKDLLMKNPEPVCFDEFEPFGRMHIAQGIMKTININKLTSAGCKVKIWIADWYAQSVMKLGGDLAKLQKVGNYFKEIWIAAGMDMEKVEFIWSTDEINSRPPPRIVHMRIRKKGIVGTLGLSIGSRGESGVKNGLITVVECIIGDG